MALLGTYGGADDVRVQANRLGAKQAGGIYGESGGDTIVPEMYYGNNDVIVTVSANKDQQVFNVVDAPKPDGGYIPEVDDYNVQGGTLSNSHWEWYIDDIKIDLGYTRFYRETFANIETGYTTDKKAVSAVRQGVSSISGKVIYHTIPPILGYVELPATSDTTA